MDQHELPRRKGFTGKFHSILGSRFGSNGNAEDVSYFQDIAQTQGPHQKQARNIYTKLRKNLVVNVFDEWERTGFAWEQYNPETGVGQRTQHFTGWTSLVVKMMVMPDLSGVRSGTRHDEL